MESYCGPNTAATVPLYLWMSAQPVEHVLQPAWPVAPVGYSYEASLPRASHLAHDYAGAAPPSLEMPGFYSAVTRVPNPNAGGLEQFLQRRPASELLSHHVYVKYNDAVQSTMMSNKDTSTTLSPILLPGPEQQLRMLANYTRANLTIGDYTNTRYGSHEQICHFKQLAHQQDGFQTAGGCPMMQEITCPNVEKDPATVVSLSLEPKHISQGLMTQDQTAVSPLLSEQSTIENESPSKSCGFDSIQMDGTDMGSIQSSGLKELNFPQGPENGTKKQGQDYMACNDRTVTTEHDANIGLKDQSKHFPSIMEEDMSILACVPWDRQEAFSCPGTSNSETAAASSELMGSDHAISRRCAEHRGISPVPRVFTCDVMVGTELAQCVSAFTQTAGSEATTDKHVNTEVQMADLDYVAMEFFKLKKDKEELEEKEKMKNSACNLGNDCDCFKRAQHAELSLLMLQYSMCRQHCWSLYCTSAGGDQVNPLLPKDPPANILGVLEKLDSDYNELRDKIQEGISLEELTPLSVDCGKLTSATYVPAQVIANLRGSLLSQCPPELQRNSTASDNSGCPDQKSTNDCQGEADCVTQESCKARSAVTLVPRGSGAFPVVQKLIKNQTTACKELTIGEVSYDAEEDLEPAEPAAAAETGQNYNFTAKGSASEETESSVLSNLTCDVTEVMTQTPLGRSNNGQVVCSLPTQRELVCPMAP